MIVKTNIHWPTQTQCDDHQMVSWSVDGFMKLQRPHLPGDFDSTMQGKQSQDWQTMDGMGWSSIKS